MNAMKPKKITEEHKKLLKRFKFNAIASSNINDSSNLIDDLSLVEPQLIKKMCEETRRLKQACMHRILGCIDLHEDKQFMQYGNMKTAYCVIWKVNHNTPFHNTEDGQMIPKFFNGSILSAYVEIKEGEVFKFNPAKLHGIMSNSKIDMFVFWF